MCLCARSACTPPLLAGVCGVGVCAWARVLAAPRLTWLGCLGVRVCVRAPLVPRHSWLGCACLGSGFGCTPPLLARVLGCACLCARSASPRHSWLGYAVWVCVLGLGLRLRPATPGWGVGVCVCLCARSACTPPLLAGVCGVGVCAWARVSAAPRHSWLGCWGLCVFVCALRLYPAAPGWAVRCGRVCFGSAFGCAPPLLAGVSGCVYACVRAPLVPRHSWLVCAVWACVLGLEFWLGPASPGWGVGVCVFVCALRLYPATPGWGVPVWLCVLGLGFRLRPATPGWGVRVCVCLCARSACTPPLLAGLFGCGCVCLGLVFGWAPPLLAGVLGCACLCACSACTPQLLAGVCGVGVCAWPRVWAAPRHSWLGCAVWVCVLGLGFRLRPATPGWHVGVCVCLCLRSACVPPLLAGVCGVGVCAWARAFAAPRHSWLGCRDVCLLVCALRLYPATPGWGVRCERVCLGSGFGWATPHLAGVLGCACLCARSACTPPLLAGVCVLGLGFWLHPATPGWGVGVCVFVCALRLYPATPGWGMRCGCVCLGSGFACAPPLLAGVSGSVCACVRASLVPRHSWLGHAVWACMLGLGFWLHPASPGWGVAVGVFVCALRLYPVTSGWGVRCGCVCLGSGFGCAPPLLAGMSGCVCACVGAPLVARHSWLGCAVWACVLGLGFRRAPPLLAGVLGFVCVCVRALLVPRHSWLGCAVWVCVFGLGFGLRPATPGWGVGVCVCLCARSACTPPLLAGVCGVGVCAWAPVLAGPRLSWLQCWVVRVCVRAPLVPRHS